MIVVDKLCYQSKLRYVNPIEKLLFALFTLTFCIVSRSILMGIFVLVINSVLTVVKGGIAFKRYRHLMMVPFTFLLLSTLAIMINFSKEPLDAFHILIPNSHTYITGSISGLWRTGSLIITAMASVSCLYFVSLNTTMTDIIEIGRKIKLPELFLELMMLIYRFIFVLLDSAYKIVTAQNSRLGNKDFKTSMKSFSSMVQTLFVISMKRSRNLYNAMEARGYDGKIRVLSKENAISKRHMIAIAIFESVLLCYTIFVRTVDLGNLF